MLAALRNAAYRRLLAAHLVSLLGTGLSTIAIGLMAVTLAGDAAAGVLGTILAVKMVTFLLLAPWAPAIAQRIGARRLMVATDVVRAIAACALPFVGDLVAAYALIFLIQASSALFTPTYQATLPVVLPREREYTSALALSRVAYDLEALASPALAGLLLVVVPAPTLFFGTGVGFAASAALIAPLALPRPAPAPEGRVPIRREVARGALLIVRTRVLRAGLLLQLAVAAAGPVILVLTIPLVRGPLGGGEGEAAGILVAFGLGSIAAAVLMPAMLPRLGLRRFLLSGTLTLALVLLLLWPVLLLPLDRTAALAFVAAIWLVAGCGYSAAVAPMGSLVREHTGDEDLPAVFAAQFSLAHGWWMLTYPLCGWGATTLGFGPTSLLLVGLSLAAIAVAAVVWRPEPEGDAAQWVRIEDVAEGGSE
ncbi:MAG: MFS transporter [Microbacterium sp.]